MNTRTNENVVFNINTLLARGIVTFHQGRSIPPAMSDGGTGELYRARSQGVIAERLSDEQYAHYTHIRDMARDAVSLIHAGRMDASTQKFADAQTELAARDASQETQLLCHAWIDQGAAYLETRQKNWAAARQRLEAAITADQHLEDDYGYAIFHIGRVHIVHLLVRLLAAEGRLEEAVVLAQNIAAYVLGHADTLPFGAGWSAERAKAVPADLQRAMLVRISSEVGTVLAYASATDGADLLAKFPSWADHAGTPVLSEIYDWGLIKQAYLSGAYEVFLSSAADFLVQGPRETTLWYAVALDFCHACAVLRPKQTRAFLGDASAAAQGWSDISAAICPPQLRLTLQAVMDNDAAPYVADRTPRRFQLYTVGLPRTGTSSLATIFANFRSANEYKEQQSLEMVTGHYFGRMTTPDFHAFLDQRDQDGHLEMDAASFNHFYLEHLIERHPQARFVFSVREPYGWTNSYMKMLMRWKQLFGDTQPQWTQDYGRMIFGDFDWDAFQSVEALNENLEAIVERFVVHWADANRRILDLLSPDRVLIVDTDNLSHSLDRLAAFANIELSDLTDQHHSNASPERHNLLDALDPAWFAALCNTHAHDVIERTGVRISGRVR